MIIPELRVAIDVKEDFEEACHGMKSSSRWRTSFHPGFNEPSWSWELELLFPSGSYLALNGLSRTQPSKNHHNCKKKTTMLVEDLASLVKSLRDSLNLMWTTNMPPNICIYTCRRNTSKSYLYCVRLKTQKKTFILPEEEENLFQDTTADTSAGQQRSDGETERIPFSSYSGWSSSRRHPEC